MKELERDLGLPSVMAISIGAMVGSGIFILPGLALEMAGPSVILAYLLAGVLVLPAALSKSEMATAMPEAGGTYIYIERGMGPLLGTIAGVGTWFSLTFKGALALVGGVPYLVLVFDLPITPVAVGAALLLIAVNLVGVKQTGRLQVAIVGIMLAALTWLVVGGVGAIEPVRYDGFFDRGPSGLLAATGFVFVSYAGVTKIASVAEEVEHPDRNIPLGMLGSLTFTTLLYVGLVVVMIGVAPVGDLAGSSVPMAIAADATLASVGVVAVVVAAVLALVSTANAGILSSSRYPFAMSRDGLAPPSLDRVHERFNTPTRAITLTGAVLIVMVVFVPIDEIAKLASAFKILVFSLVNLALIAFREADLPEYEPSFESPLYPFPQLVGIVGGVALIPLMGAVALGGAILITAGSLAWYYLYVYRRGGLEREGAAADAVRRTLGRRAVAETEAAMAAGDEHSVLVVVTESTSPETEGTLVDVGAAIGQGRDGTVHVVRFDEVPDQTPLERETGRLTPGDESFEDRMRARVADDPSVAFGEVVSHDTARAVVNRAANLGVDAILLERRDAPIRETILGGGVGWIAGHADCDVIEVDTSVVDDPDTVTVISDRGPYDATKVAIADGLAAAADATIDLRFAVDPDTPARRRDTIRDYLSELASLSTAPVTTRLVAADEPADGPEPGSDGRLVVATAERSGRWLSVDGHDRAGIDAADGTAVLVHPVGRRAPGTIRRAVQDRLF